ncbi:hypothetical protein COOONC_18989 [Cooperia oncophora]
MDTDRKLADIRAEYSEQMDMRRRELERQRMQLEEQFAEKDRVLRHKIELQLLEKESALEITRKSLETRLAELAMNKEHLDRAKAEFQVKFASDVEILNQEWAKLSGKQEELRSFYRQEFEAEQQELLEKSEELEKVNALLKKKLSDSSAEIYQMRSQLTRMSSLEEDLKIVNERLHKEVEERHRLSRCSYEVDRLRDENAYLKEELEQLKSYARESKTKTGMDASKEQAFAVKINELRNIIRVMSDKIASLTSERDYLRQLLRDTRKEITGDTAVKLRSALIAGESKDFRVRHQLRDTDSSEENSVSSSSVSSSGLRNIKKRFSTLEDLAKTLDTTIDCVAAARSTQDQFAGSPELLVSEGYDDFCRSLKQNVERYSSPKKTTLKEAAIKETMNIGSPASVSRAGLYPDQLKDVIGTLSSSVREPAALPQTTGADTKEPVRGEIPVQSSTASVAAAVPGDTTSSFAERLKARNEMKRTIKFPTMTAKVSLDHI